MSEPFLHWCVPIDTKWQVTGDQLQVTDDKWQVKSDSQQWRLTIDSDSQKWKSTVTVNSKSQQRKMTKLKSYKVLNVTQY